MISSKQTWVFGRFADLHFDNGVVTPQAGRAIDTFEGCSSASDANGNLLFYTDGVKLWDSNNVVRVTGLKGDRSSTQSVLIVPKPETASQYYILTTSGASGGNHHFDGILLDISNWTHTQIGALAPTAGYSPSEKLTTIQASNCIDFWVITVVQNSALTKSFFRVYKIDTTGISYKGETLANEDIHDVGYMKGNHSFNQLGIANFAYQEALVYGFDNVNGTVNTSTVNRYQVPLDSSVPDHAKAVYGVEFSPDDSRFYFSVVGQPNTTAGMNMGYLFQVDPLSAASPVTQIASHEDPGHNNRYAFGALQLAGNGIIYLARDGEQRLAAIRNPNGVGAACDYELNQLLMAGASRCWMGLPNLYSTC